MHNNQVLGEYIKEKGYKTLNTEWVLWALELGMSVNNLNPAWLRAKLIGDNEPKMSNEN